MPETAPSADETTPPIPEAVTPLAFTAAVVEPGSALPPPSPADKVFSALDKQDGDVLTRDEFAKAAASGLLSLSGNSAEVRAQHLRPVV